MSNHCATRCCGGISVHFGSTIVIIVLTILAVCRIILGAWFLATIDQYPCVQSNTFLSWTAFADIVLIEAASTIAVAVYGTVGLFRSDLSPLKFVAKWLFWQLIVGVLVIAYAVMISTNYKAIAEGYLLCSSLPAGPLFIEPVAEKLTYFAHSLMEYGICSICFISASLLIQTEAVQKKMTLKLVKNDSEGDMIVEAKCVD